MPGPLVTPVHSFYEESVMAVLSPPRNNESPCTGGRLWPPHSRGRKPFYEEQVNL
jgi:hypothetical protein